MKNHHKIKLIAASVALAVSFGASAGLGGLNVQSHLGEPFSGSITVTGDEAQALLKGGKATVSNSNLRTSVRKSGDKAVVTIHSSKAIKDPVLIFQVGAGSQSREYTAIIDPAGYSGKTDGSSRARSSGESSSNSSADNNSYHSQFDRQAARDRINRAIQNGNQNETVRKEAVRKDKNNTNKPVQTQAQPSKQQQQSSVGANGTEIRYGKQHLVRQGETLTEIATKIRPQGMTVEQTIQALVNANPGVFIGKDADRMLAGKVLYIPMHGDMKSTASKPAQVKPPVQEGNKPQAQGSSEKAGTATPPKETPVENTKVENKKEDKKEDKKAEPVQEAKPETKPAVTTAGTPEQNKAETGAASAEQVNVLPEPNASSATANTEPQEISQAQADVEARIASAVATEKQQEEASSEDGGLWRWLLIGGAASAGLLLLLFLLGKRKNSAVAPVAGAIDQDDQDEDDLDISIEDHVFPAATAPQPQPQVVAETSKSEEDGLEIEDDFDDEVFFNEPVPVAEPAQENVDLDLNELDNTQASIVSGAVTIDEETEKRRDIDWDTVESTESVYEPEPENPYQHVAVVMEDRTAEVETEPQYEEEAPSVSSFAATPVSSVSDDLPEAQPEAPEEEPIPFEVEIEEPKSETIDVVETEEAETQSEESEEGWDFFAEEPKTVKAIEPFPELGTQEETSSEVEVADIQEDVLSEVEAADKQADSPEEALDFVVEETEQPQSETDTQPFEIKQDEPLAFQDGEDFSIENTQEASADETIEWENLGVEDTADISNEHSGFESGFISESVGMTAPLEAKYDLAKMYVEIGDPDAARETLTELLEDASGEIRNKAQALMNELNA